MILFIAFLKVIDDKHELQFMKCNVVQFFVFMLAVLTVQLLFNLIFYLSYDPKHQQQEEKQVTLERERLNAIAFYVHSGIELLFNIVILSYLV